MPKSTVSLERDSAKVGDHPAPTLLKAWGKRMQRGSALVVPVFVSGSWTVQIPRGNKRVLRLNVAGKKNGPVRH